MRTSGWQLCLIAASTFSAISVADFRVTSHRTKEAVEGPKFANYVKSFTLTSSKPTRIESLDLSLTGTVYVTYSNDVPADVVGYVNVSGSSKVVVDAITVYNQVDGVLPDVNNLDDVFGNTKKQLSVSLGHDIDEGFLLTEIFLSAHSTVSKVSTRRTSNVVIEEDVLISDSTSHALTISATGLSTVYVSSPETEVKVRELELEATGGGKIQFDAKYIYLWQKLELEASGDASIKVLCPAVVAGQLDIDAESSDSEICMSSKHVQSALLSITGEEYISLPNSKHKHGTYGSSACKRSSLPPREPAQFIPGSGR
uniref:Auto-transporter adhesin head GIN domain-containing protein n=1 Tax=Hyaloperonospora arabidopsidis (strain Emoy2) TaxID=559515 RepID=M4C0D2_HYAAE